MFILFDSSNYMYHRRGFVFAQDSIAEFVRSLDTADHVAFYSYSRDLTRASLLTSDRSQVLRGVRATVNGDDSALYNALLLTLKDAAQYTGRRVLVVFSNGPDNSSMVPPEDVSELAQSEGVPIYMISTREAQLDPISAVVFTRMSANTGGQAYFAKDWHDQEQAFSSIRERPGPSLPSELLSAAQSQPRLARHHREISRERICRNIASGPAAAIVRFPYVCPWKRRRPASNSQNCRRCCYWDSLEAACGATEHNDDRLRLGGLGRFREAVLELEDPPKTVAQLLDRPVEFFHTLGFVLHPAGIDVGDHFHAQTDRAPNALHGQCANQLAVIQSAELAFSQLLHRPRRRADVIHRVAIFLQKAQVDAFALQGLFEIL